jgi:hypothetical protein
MQTPTPTRITIELERRPRQRSGWSARARVDGPVTSAPRSITVVTSVPDDGDATVLPAAYEPAPCTCEDGLCARDHEHE